jgi:hypothetical protein
VTPGKSNPEIPAAKPAKNDRLLNMMQILPALNPKNRPGFYAYSICKARMIG